MFTSNQITHHETKNKQKISFHKTIRKREEFVQNESFKKLWARLFQLLPNSKIASREVRWVPQMLICSRTHPAGSMSRLLPEELGSFLRAVAQSWDFF